MVADALQRTTAPQQQPFVEIQSNDIGAWSAENTTFERRRHKRDHGTNLVNYSLNKPGWGLWVYIAQLLCP
jgi:hypothetical protein